MKVLVTGGRGQLGRALSATLPRGVELECCGHAELALEDPASIRARLAAARPAVVINCAAFTAVDRAESEPERAWATNCEGVRELALAARAADSRLIHVSTDYVFSGEQSRPYREDDAPSPLSVYGRSKHAGEQAVLAVFGPSATIVRTQWLYETGGASFVATMLRLLRERGAVRVVADQVGTPTWARGLALALWRLAARPDAVGVFHHSDAGVASWYDFAVAIEEEAAALHLLPARGLVEPITTAEYPTPARRPAYTVLDGRRLRALTGLPPVHWRVSLRGMLAEMASG